MKKRLLIIISIITVECILLNSNCTTSKQPYKIVKENGDSLIKVTGIAENSILGACLSTKGGLTYWIEEKKEWEDTLINNNVEIEGVLYKKIWTKKKKKRSIPLAKMTGVQYIIKNAKVRKLK